MSKDNNNLFNNKCEYDFTTILPKEISFKIFNYIPAKYLVKECSKICKNWNTIIKTPQYWISRSFNERCREILPPPEMINDPKYRWNLSKIFILRPFNRNLITNPSGEHGLEGWESYPASQPFEIERPYGSMQASFPGLETCFVSSFSKRTKFYCFKPTIYISEMNSYRKDAAAYYSLRVRIHCGDINLNRMDTTTFTNNRNTFAYKKKVDQWTDPVWEKVEHNFSDYSSGNYQIFFETIGKDRMFWAGNYGSKCCNATIIIKYEFNKPYQDKKNDQF
ncbi:F-box domain and F-box associated (FBA) domain and Galactose-binding domain-like-containing protein [Strongyloides ratti]|uniref:F-box domain and F-box associated (FBA) domain and Galactose-binding domain-like-containing protein n=1 Tax=Strongyloides ratti TaxID=34506 RepID=A0A090LFR5_STRRB|nr:F-box domain and F-box associated (FBA) domain and Galactose-binding domain-like-containing protein [Strongyloides ratti]CEF68626.1 F-box domain and F-box associated (FBA) domain and Galactose-binding domain-like-containing protein [Strongyloides ratti]